MRKRMLSFAVALAATLTIFGAGTASAGQGKATVNVVHGIPGLDVAVCVNGAKAIRDFNPGEIVAGVIHNPEGDNPFLHPETARKRRAFALGRLLDQGYITEAQAAEAKKEPLPTVKPANPLTTPTSRRISSPSP